MREKKPKGPRGRPRRYPFPKMNVGDTCVYPWDDTDHYKVYVRVRTSVLRWARQNNKTFTTEKTDTGVLIKRVE